MKAAGALNGLPRELRIRCNMHRIYGQELLSSHLFDVPLGNNLALYHSPSMSISSSKNQEWNLLAEEFDALLHKQGVRQDNSGQFLDGQQIRRFGELIAWAAGHKAKGHHGPWPPGPHRANR